MRKLKLSKAAEKSLQLLLKSAPEVAKLIVAQLKHLCEKPQSNNTKKLSGYSYHRARVGNYRIIYEFDEENLTVYLVEHRRKVYEVLKRRQ